MTALNDSGTEAPDRVLTITRTFAAPRTLVFSVWTKPEHILRWWGPRGYRLSHCEMDFRPGGAWRFCMRSAEGEEHWIHGVYHEIVAPERIVFTYVNERGGFETLVTLLFVARGNQTELRFRQVAFPTVEERDGHNRGWSSTFELLDDYLAGLPESTRSGA